MRGNVICADSAIDGNSAKSSNDRIFKLHLN
jgi:hypothetical protein